MALQKKDLKAALIMLSVSFAAEATNEVLDDLLSAELKERLTALDAEFPVDAATETLLEQYNLTTALDDENQGEDFYQFKAKIGFKQPWQGGMFSKAKGEEFDCDDEKLIKHLASNALISLN